MTRTRIKLNHAGFHELLTSPEVQADLSARAARIAAAAGPGYEVTWDKPGKNRARASVQPTTPRAIRREARDHRLLGAMDAGRG